MQNLIIIDDNIPYIQKVIDSISKSVNDIRLCNFFTSNNTNMLNIINNKEIDIIIVNIEVVGIDIIKFIQEKNIDVYKKSIIFLYKDVKEIKNLVKKGYEKYIFKCISLSKNIDYLLDTVRKLTYLKENANDNIIIKNRIERIE